MYQFIALHSWDYLREISLKANVAAGEGNNRNVNTKQRDEIGVAVQSLL